MKKSDGKRRNRGQGGKRPRNPVAAPGAARPAPAGASEDSGGLTRRGMFRLARTGAIGVAALGAGGWALASYVQNHLELHDLSTIGNGVPAVVQIHDPDCPICRRLQKAMLSAADDFRSGEMQFRVANIRTDEGRALANRHRVPHVTLLLMDGGGEVRQVLRGERRSDELAEAFRFHLDRTSAAKK